MAGRKNKYQTHVEPRLVEIEAWARDGNIDETIAKKLGVAYSTFREYTKKYSALSAALKKGKEVVDIEVENAMLKSALGYDYIEEQGFKLKEVYYKDGKRHEKEWLDTVEVTRHKPADTTSQIFWLKNRKPTTWRDKQDIEHSGEVTNKNIDLSDMTEQELRNLAKLDDGEETGDS